MRTSLCYFGIYIVTVMYFLKIPRTSLAEENASSAAANQSSSVDTINISAGLASTTSAPRENNTTLARNGRGLFGRALIRRRGRVSAAQMLVIARDLCPCGVRHLNDTDQVWDFHV